MATRSEFSKATKRQASRYVSCAECSIQFDRGYPISASRACKPQYCSKACKKTKEKKRALDNLQKRFWAKVNKLGRNECWEWRGRVNHAGYALFDVGGSPQIGSRIAYEFHYKVHPDDKFVCHSCDNPSCVNPYHLWIGSHADNMADCTHKGRTKNGGARGEEVGNSVLKKEDVRKIRRSTLTNKALAKKYGVTTAAIYNVRTRKTWGWLDAA